MLLMGPFRWGDDRLFLFFKVASSKKSVSNVTSKLRYIRLFPNKLSEKFMMNAILKKVFYVDLSKFEGIF